MRAAIAAMAAFALLALAAPARAEGPSYHLLADGPAAVGFYDSDFASGRRARLRTEVALTERFGAIIDTPNFYGHVVLDTLISGSYVIRDRAEVFVTIDALRWQFAQNATLTSTAMSLGQTTAGAAFRAVRTEHFTLTPYARLLLPTATDTLRVRNVGAEAGVALEWRPSDRFALHGVVAGDVSAGLSAANAFPRGGALLLVGAQYSPASWFALALDLQAQLGHRATFDLFAPALAIRFRAYRGLGIELDAALPVAGADRRLAIGQLRISYRF